MADQIDSRLSLFATTPQFEGPADVATKVAKLNQLTIANEDTLRARAEADRELVNQRTLSDIFANNLRSDGSLDRSGVFRGTAGAGLGYKIPAMMKQFGELDKDTAETAQKTATAGKTSFETAHGQLKAINDSIAGLLARPDVNPDMVIQEIQGLVARGVIDPQHGAAMARSVPGPAQLREFLTSKGLENMEAGKRLEALMPKYDEQDRGGVINEGTINNLTGVRTAGRDVTKTATPDAQLSAATSRANNAATNARLGAVLGNGAFPAKPMPPAALKQQTEALQAISTLAGTNKDMDSLLGQIDGGELKLGPFANLVSQGRNFVGESNQNSRNFASFKGTIEKIRNATLLLNKGVQTEGDAQRALNELFSNLNDEKNVRQRLNEIRDINERAVAAQRQGLEELRINYGRDPIDLSDIENPPPALNSGNPTPSRRPAAPGPASPAAKPRPPLSAFGS